MERNDLVQNVQGNRNVFIDYPELAWYLFSLTPPIDMQTPSGDAAASSGETATIQAVSSDLTLGTVSVSGNVITASPKAGCYVTGYTILSGSATVVRDGDRFTVTADASCTIRIEFAEHTYTVTFSVPDGVTAIAAQTCGASGLTLPTPEGTPSDTSQQYAFVGWVTSVCPTTTQKAGRPDRRGGLPSDGGLHALRAVRLWKRRRRPGLPPRLRSAGRLERELSDRESEHGLRHELHARKRPFCRGSGHRDR